MISLKLYDIIKNLLNENVTNDEVLDSIRGKYHVRIKYDDGMEDNGGNSKGSRIIQPVAVGTTKKGYPVVRAFQVNGNSRRGAPKWKFFRLDRIVSWEGMPNKHFTSPPDESYGKYNKHGDRSMGIFIDNAKFDDFGSPLDKAKAEKQDMLTAPKVSTKNLRGPIRATQQWKKNVFTSQPNSKNYAQYAKNVNDTSNKTDSYWDDYERALQQASLQNQTPRPQQPQNGPIKNSYDVDDIDFDENDFIENKNRK